MTTDREKRRQELFGLLGDLPERSGVGGVEVISEEDCGSYVLEKLVLDLNGMEAVPAYFTRPKGQKGPFPTVLYNHAHGGDYELGKDELLAGRKELQKPPYAEMLSRKGYCALCIDAWAFGERQGRTESEIFKQMLWEGRVMWGMMVYDSLRAIDYLVSRPDVDPDAIATLGLSMGSTMAWWVAALDTRVKVCIDMCCLTDFHALIEAQGLDEHNFYYYVPRLLKHFTTSQINALIAPRAHLAAAGNYDRLTPSAGLDVVDAELRKVYKEDNAPEAWKLLRYDTGHFENSHMRAEIVSFLEKWL